MISFAASKNRMDLFKLFVLTTLLGWAIYVPAQSKDGNYNPFVSQGVISPAPLPPVEFGGEGLISFKVGNSGSDAMEWMAGQPEKELRLVITLAGGVPDVGELTAETALLAIGGGYSTMFEWSYDLSANTYTGRQKSTLPPMGVDVITVAYKVMQNSSTPSNGFLVQLFPPSYTLVSNTGNDDKVSSYTWTEYRDYGDAPESYGVAYHRIQENPDFRVYLGKIIDGESASLFSTAAHGDDGDGEDDEDGVTLPFLVRGTSVTIPVTAYGQGYLNAWMDWNGDGDFLDEGERVFADRLINAPVTKIEVSVPLGAPADMSSYARFRFGPKGIAPSGGAAIGEVEDYQVHILHISPSISGNVYHDTDLMEDNLVDGTGTNALGRLYVNLLDVADRVVAATQVSEDGTYSFTDLAEGDYCLQLTIYEGIPGEPKPVTRLVKDGLYVAENLGSDPGCDGSPDGLLFVTVPPLANLADANFGIVKLPDLTINLTASPNVMAGVTFFDVVVRIAEINQVNTRGPIVVIIPRDTRWSVSGGFDAGLTQLDNIVLQNNVWEFDVSDSNYYVFTTVAEISAGGQLVLGFRALFDPGNSRGIYTITAQLLSGSGGEFLYLNNSDSEKLDYFIN